MDTIAAEIIAGPSTLEFRDMTIGKGSADGVEGDMAVISPAGVVGRVALASPRAARVQMLIDRSAAAGAMIERTRVQGLIRGDGNMLRMEYVSGTADVKQGDLVVTSGIDKIYPKGFVIGTVESIERGRGLFHEIMVRPSVDFSRLEEVLVVTTPPPAITAAEIAEEAEAMAARERQRNQPRPPSLPPPAAAPARVIPRNATPPAAVPPNDAPSNVTPPVPRNATPPKVAPQNRSPQNGTPREPGA